jgi:hypothetical protein
MQQSNKYSPKSYHFTISRHSKFITTFHLVLFFLLSISLFSSENKVQPKNTEKKLEHKIKNVSEIDEQLKKYQISISSIKNSERTPRAEARGFRPHTIRPCIIVL